MADEQNEEQADLTGDPTAGGDLDAMFASGEPAGAAPGAAISVSPEVDALLGTAAREAVRGLATRALEVLTVGIDSIAGQRAVLVDATITTTDYASLQAEFAAVEHAGFEVKVEFAPGESHLAAILVPLPELGALLSLDVAPASMQDAAHAQMQLDAIAASMREVLDLVSLTLFGDALQGVEATLSDLRIGQPEYTIGIVGDVAGGAPALRVHLAMARTDGSVFAIQLIIPSTMVMAFATRLDPSLRSVEEEPTPLRRSAPPADARREQEVEEPRGFGLSDNPANVSPLRPAGTFGASTGDDVDVHPVRFPPLPSASQAPAPAPRSLDLIMDVSMRVTVELGRSSMTVEDVLALGPGSVIELNKLAGEPVDILVNEQLIARGEVVVVDENFGVRVTEIVSPRRRATAMAK